MSVGKSIAEELVRHFFGQAQRKQASQVHESSGGTIIIMDFFCL
jgi:hypothetical protein